MIIRVKVTRQENTDYFGCSAGEIVSVDLEEYVAAVVASEIGNSHIEACKAQAIAARTFAMHYVGEGKNITDKSSSHQAFRASRWDAKKYPNANTAAMETAGMVLTWQGDILKTCSYSSSNGGRTVSSQERWGGIRPYLIGQDDPWDAAACREREEKGYAIVKGHGVGMSQYGAVWAAQNGVGYREILGFYYAGAQIALDYGRVEQMPEEIKPSAELSSRALIPFTNEHFAAFLLKLVGLPYWYGTCLYKCTTGLLNRKAKQYSSHYGDDRMATYKKHIAEKLVADDCIGAAKGYAWTSGGEGVVEAIGTDNAINSKYGSNGCPDKGTSGMFAYAKDKGMPWGTIDTLPELVGVAVTYSGHVGYYEGNGVVFEAKGFKSGNVLSKLSDGKWTHWYYLPFLDYGEDNDLPSASVAVKYTLGARLLRKGCKGEDVAHLQRLLVGMGYDLGSYGENKDGVDGSYGDKTVKAVKRFQSFAQIEADGKYGSITHKAMMGVLDDIAKSEADEEDEELILPNEQTVLVTADDTNVRSGPSESYKVLTQVDKGDVLPYLATAEAYGWHAVEVCGKVGWIHGQYAEVRG